MDITTKAFWKATAIRCARSFLSIILGAQTSNNLMITDIDWRSTLIAATTSTFFIFIACLLAGLPEVNLEKTLYDLDNEGDPKFVEKYARLEYEDYEEPEDPDEYVEEV